MSLDTLERLLQPIDPAAPCGTSIRYDPALFEIRMEREEDDPNLPMGVWERPLKRANWPLIARHCAELIEKRSKDLQLAVWLTDAWVRIDQVEGLARGLQLLHGLLLHYWDTVHPVVEEGDLDPRLAAFEWLNEAVPVTLRLQVALAHIPDHKPSMISVADWDRMTATELVASQTPDQSTDDSDHATPHALTRSMVVAYSHGHGQALARRLAQDLDAAVMGLNRLEALLRQKVGDGQAPSLSGLHKGLSHLQRIVAQLQAIERPPSGAPPQPAVPAQEPSMDHVHAFTADPAQPIPVPADAAATDATVMAHGWRSREDAYRTLETLADYLGKVEPHSPTPYLIRRAVTWGRMELPELMAEIVREEGDLNRLISLLGLQRN